MTAEPADKKLLADIAKGDRTALKGIYDRYADGVRIFAQGWLSDPFEAADIMHETMMEVWRSADRFAGRSSVKTWIFSIARNKSIDRNRKAGRGVNQEPDTTIADETPDPEATTAAFQDAQRVRACIDTLSPSHQSAIHLAFFQEMSYPEIAALENVPVGTVKTRIMHAKKLLMRCLGEQS